MRWFNRKPPLAGQIDHMSHRIARGWAWSPGRPTRRVRLEVFYRDIFLGQVSAGMYREDLRAHGVGDGHHAFMFHLPADVLDENFDPAGLSMVSAGPERRPLPFASQMAIQSSGHRLLTTDYRQVLGPFLEGLGKMDASPARLRMQAGRRKRIDELCAGVSELEVSAFVEHIACKYGLDHLISNDIDALWRWYLGTYAAECGPRLAPLSRIDVERLTRTAAGGRSYAASLVLGPNSTDYPFEWALEADRLFVADSLVGRGDVEALRTVGTTLSAYPLSAFMRTAMAEIAIFRSLPTATERQRKRLYALFMVIGLRNPSFLSYLPTEWMLRLLESPAGLEETTSDLFGPHLGIDQGTYASHVESMGYDLASQTFCGHRYERHRVLGGPAIVTSPAPVDVQVIGPFRRKIGLGESCRRVAAALRTTSLSCNLVDYDIGTSGGFIDENEQLGITRPARLNVLHLNLEEIPEALGYLPDVFSQSHAVAMPYWELSGLARPHRLGLRAVDEIWAASRFLVDVFSGNGKDVRWVGMSCSSAPVPTIGERLALRQRLGLSPKSFIFLTTSDALSRVQRKNPLAVIEAFRSAFETSDVALVVKTQNLQGILSDAQMTIWNQVRALCRTDPRIMLVDESFDAASQRTLLAACDCLVSLHRAEGLGLDVIDALDLGTPVIATNYSGTRDLCTAETAWPVDLDLRAVEASDYSFVEPEHVWAEPRVDSATRAMREVFVNTRERALRADRGKHLVSTTATTQCFGMRLEEAVRARLGRP